MVRRIHAKRLIKNGVVLDDKSIEEVKFKLKNIINTHRRALIGILGSPGSGKSTMAKKISEKGFLGIPPEKILLLDDLRDQAGKQYRLRELKRVARSLSDKVLVLVDYRSAVYLRNLDFLIVLPVDEKERLRNLGKRSPRSLKRYGKARYSVPPIRLCYKNVFLLDKSIEESGL